MRTQPRHLAQHCWNNAGLGVVLVLSGALLIAFFPQLPGAAEPLAFGIAGGAAVGSLLAGPAILLWLRKGRTAP